jgi:uncharacterized lipoprotein YajG
MKFQTVILGVFVALLTGCAVQNPTLSFTPQDVLPSAKKIDYELKSINVSIAKDEERQGATQVGFLGNQYETSFRQTFKEALEESIAKSAIFNDLSNNKMALTAKVMQFETPSMSTQFETKMIVRYQMLNRATGKLVFTRDISSVGSVPFDYAFMGAVRYTEARNRAVRDNIVQFIQSLGEFKE